VIENAQGVVDFNLEPLLAAGLTIVSATNNSTEHIFTWNWDFGNGEKSTSKEAKVFYKEQSTYLITLTATSETGCIYTASKLYMWTYKK
jgi:PKD repeat protein